MEVVCKIQQRIQIGLDLGISNRHVDTADQLLEEKSALMINI